MNDNLVSIVTPAYKAANYINDTIKSVIDQTFQNWEMLIVDDKSPDNTCEIVEGWCKKDSRIKLLKQKENGGPALARNSALGKASGRWIAFLDSDDIWLPSKLHKQIEFHCNSEAVISYTEYRRINSDNSRVGHLIEVPEKIDYYKLLSNTAIATSSVLIDKKLAGNFKMKNTYYDDFACWLSLLNKGGFAIGLKEDLLRYRVLDGSVSRNKYRSAKEVWNTYRKVEAINVISAVWYFINYVINGLFKYRKF
jgi:teichuronic acid biosynthesis glycosyltransferase TuaG